MQFGPLLTDENGISVSITEGNKRLFIRRKDVDFIYDAHSGCKTVVDDPEFYDDFDSKIIKAAKDNKQAWWGRNVQDGTIEKAFLRSYNNCLNVQLIEGKSRFYLPDKTHVDINSFTGETKCDIVLEPIKIIFYKRHFELDWRLVQVIAKTVQEQETEDYPEECMFED